MRADAGDFDGATAAIAGCLAADPEYPNAHNFAGWMRFTRPQRTAEDLAAAIACFHDSLRVEPDGGVLSNLGDALVAAGRPDEARLAMEEAASNEPLAAAAENWLAWYFAEKAPDAARAVAHARRAAELRPGWGVARLNLGKALERAGEAAEAYRAYLDALACGDAHDEACAERRTLAIARDLLAHGTLPTPPAAGPAHDRMARLERTLSVLGATLSAMPELAGTFRFFATSGVAVPEGDVPFGWIGTTADGRAHIHALVTDLKIFSVVETLERVGGVLVFRSVQVQDADVREAAAAVARWIRSESPLPASRITPLDAVVFAHGTLFEAFPGRRMRARVGADYYAPTRPAITYVRPEKDAAELGVSFEARPEGGVLVRGMPEAMGALEPTWQTPTYEAFVAALPAIAASTGCGLAGLDAFRARPLPIGTVVGACVAALREARVVRGGIESVVNDSGYPHRASNGFVRAHQGRVERHVADVKETPEGFRIEVADASFVVGNLAALDAAMPAFVERVREQLARLTHESLVEGARFLVLTPFLGLEAGEVVRLAECRHYPRDGGSTYEFQSVGRPAVRAALSSWSSEACDILANLHRYLAKAKP